jgi:hypothetical protein
VEPEILVSSSENERPDLNSKKRKRPQRSARNAIAKYQVADSESNDSEDVIVSTGKKNSMAPVKVVKKTVTFKIMIEAPPPPKGSPPRTYSDDSGPVSGITTEDPVAVKQRATLQRPRMQEPVSPHQHEDDDEEIVIVYPYFKKFHQVPDTMPSSQPAALDNDFGRAPFQSPKYFVPVKNMISEQQLPPPPKYRQGLFRKPKANNTAPVRHSKTPAYAIIQPKHTKRHMVADECETLIPNQKRVRVQEPKNSARSAPPLSLDGVAAFEHAKHSQTLTQVSHVLLCSGTLSENNAIVRHDANRDL